METKYYSVKLSEAEIRVMLNMIEYYRNENIAYRNNFLGIKVIARNIKTELQRTLLKMK